MSSVAPITTMALGVNKFDQIVGVYVDSLGKMHGFVLTNPLQHAHFQSIDDRNGNGNTDGFLATPR